MKKYFYLLTVFLFLVLFIGLFYYNLTIAYIPHDYNMFRDFHNFLNPWTGDRWQPIVYFLNYLAVQVFKLQPFWPKTIIFGIFISNFLLGFWFLNLVTKNKIISSVIVFLFAIYCRGSAIALIYTGGSIISVYVFLVLLSLISYYYFIQKRRWYFLLMTILLWLLATMVYEAAIIVPVLLLVMEIYFCDRFVFKRTFIYLLPFLFLIAVLIFITFKTAVPMSKNKQPVGIFQRGDYYVASFPEIIQRYNYFMIAHLPLVMEDSLFKNDRHLTIIKPVDIFPKNLEIIIGILLSSVLILFLKVPKYSKFFLLCVLITILPFSVFVGSGGLDERYVYLSGLFFIAFLISMGWFLMAKKLLGKIFLGLLIFFFGWKNLEILLLKINQWEVAGRMNKDLTVQILENKSLLSSAPIFIKNFPYTTYNLGTPYNEIYFLNDRVDPLHIFIAFESQEQAIFDYLRIQKCQPDILLNRKAIGWDYQNGKFVDFDIVGLAQKSTVNIDSIDCSQ